MEEGDIAAITQNEVNIFDSSGKIVAREIQILNTDPVNLSKGKFKHFMEKEIFEQPQVISQALGFYLNASKEMLSLPILPERAELTPRPLQAIIVLGAEPPGKIEAFSICK